MIGLWNSIKNRWSLLVWDVIIKVSVPADLLITCNHHCHADHLEVPYVTQSTGLMRASRHGSTTTVVCPPTLGSVVLQPWKENKPNSRRSSLTDIPSQPRISIRQNRLSQLGSVVLQPWKENKPNSRWSLTDIPSQPRISIRQNRLSQNHWSSDYQCFTLDTAITAYSISIPPKWFQQRGW